MLIEIKRAYGGLEGKRIRVGDRFWVLAPGGKPAPEGIRTMELQRFNQLKQQRLADKVQPGSSPARPTKERQAPRRQPAPEPRAKVQPDSNGSKAGVSERLASKKKEPAPRSSPLGGPKAGEAVTSSSSQAAPQTGTSTLKQRGTRRGQAPAGSPSTTPTDSSPGQTSSTPATPNGGDTTTASPDSPAFV